MSGQPPVMPPTLSYKSKAKREQEEREREEREQEEREREEREREEREREQEERERRERREEERREAERARTLSRPPAPAPPGREEPSRDETPRPSAEDPRSLVMFEEDALAPTRREIDDIEMLGGPEEVVVEEEETEEEVEEGPKRTPSRPPKSPDMRPVAVGFILVFTGLAQFIYGVLAMVSSPQAAEGPWATMVQWGVFSLGLTAAFLGLLAIRGGLWSFRKERFSVVKVGAIAASLAVWAWWIPWLFGLACLVIVTRTRDEYYPFYDPRWDAPEWARPPPSADEGEDEEGDEVEVRDKDGGEDEEVPGRERTKDVSARDFLDDVSLPDDKEASGLQDSETSAGDGWEDLA